VNSCCNLTIKIIALAFGLLLTGSTFAGQESGKPSELAELKTAIAELIAEKDVPGVGIAMVDENGPVWVGAIGRANIENNVLADEDTLFRIASISKMFVALSVLKLVEEGKLSLDDKLSELAPDVIFENQWETTDPVRVVHLLEHTTGWDDIHLPEYAHNDPTPASSKQSLDFHPHSRISRWKPGSRMAYSNSGPPVAAYIVEKISGQNFEDYVQENFFDPIGMESTTYFLSDEFKTRGATSYGNGNQELEYQHMAMRPSGSINAPARDMAKFVAFYLQRGAVDGQQLISEASLRRMETVESTNAARAGQETGYGLNNHSSTYKNWSYREHRGAISGSLAEFSYLPEANAGHAIMINSDDRATFIEISSLIRDYETRHLIAKDEIPAIEIGAEHRNIEGLYYPINSRQQNFFFLDRLLGVQKLVIDGNALQRSRLFGGEVALYFPVSPDLYKSKRTGLISLSRAVDPLAGPVVHSDNTVLKPVATWLIYLQLGVVVLWGLSIASSLLYFLVWIVRKLRGRIPAGATVQIRLWPLLAGVSIIVFLILFMLAVADPFNSLGAPTAISVGMLLSTIAFALFAVLGAYTSVKERQTPMNQGNYWYSTVSSFVHLIVAAYLWWFGVIGFVAWA